MALQRYTKEWLEELCKESYSYAEVLRKAGRKQAGGNQTTLKKKIEEWNIDISHFTGERWQWSPNLEQKIKEDSIEREKYSLEEVFSKNSPVTQKMLRGYIKRHNILEYKCQKCGCDGHWQDGIISLEVHHINGNNTDNEISNLQYLCPNCHALTDNYRGRNIGNNSGEE